MRGRVAVDLERFGITLGEDADFDVGLERASELDELRRVSVAGSAVKGRDVGGESSVGEARADRARDVEGGGSGGNLLLRSVRKLDANVVSHHEPCVFPEFSSVV